MGAWGPALFSDDLACDIRDGYREMIEDGVEDEVATVTLIQRYTGILEDPDEGPVFWMALAFTQSKIGRLDEFVRDRALRAIDLGEGLHLWEENPRLLAKRKAVLEKTKRQLTGPQPERKKLQPPSRHITDLEPGDVLAFAAGGRYSLFRVARLNDSRVAVAPILALSRTRIVNSRPQRNCGGSGIVVFHHCDRPSREGPRGGPFRSIS